MISMSIMSEVNSILTFDLDAGGIKEMISTYIKVKKNRAKLGMTKIKIATSSSNPHSFLSPWRWVLFILIQPLDLRAKSQNGIPIHRIKKMKDDILPSIIDKDMVLFLRCKFKGFDKPEKCIWKPQGHWDINKFWTTEYFWKIQNYSNFFRG